MCVISGDGDVIRGGVINSVVVFSWAPVQNFSKNPLLLERY